ncbi:hypothetical protein BGW42_005414 [Actinomortierella wolfii]|nr:hypothetical protein BGW42_005414 [Actinomortierella wolfii]
MDFTFTSTPSTTAGDTPVARPSQVFTFGTPFPQHQSQVHSLPPNQGEASVPFTPPNLASPGPSQQQLQQPPQQHLYNQSIFSPQVGHIQQHANDIESRQLNPGGRMTLKQEHGVGDSKRWRNRLWNQIESRIKDTRVSRQNARRQGLFLGESSSANNIPGDNGGIVGGCRSSGSEDDSLPQLSEEEEQRIIAEEWEKFKAEHAATLWAELQGLSDVEIEEFEQEMLQQRGEYNPSYDMLLQQEEDEMQSAIEEYLRSQSLSSANNTSISIPMATSNTSSIEDQVVMLLPKLCWEPCL